MLSVTRGLSRSRWWLGATTVAVAPVAYVTGEIVSDSAPAPIAVVAQPQAPCAAPYEAPEDPRELLVVDDAMRAFIAQHVPSTGSPDERLHRLVSAILRPDGLDFTYDGAGTFDARETFRRRRGNCASYSFMLVAMARELGFQAAFQNTERAMRWTRIGDLVVVIRHLNVKLTTRYHTYLADLQPDLLPRGAVGELREIRDETAYAQFYCNIGFGHLVNGRTDEALRYLTVAIAIDPNYAGGWTNRALLQVRLGDIAAARADFERALRADPRNESALEGYSRVLQRLGLAEDLRQAKQLERKVRTIRARNPYYQHYLASEALERGSLAEAEKLLRRAIALKRDDPEFYAQWVSVLEQLGREAEARRAAKRLDKLRAELAAEPGRYFW